MGLFSSIVGGISNIFTNKTNKQNVENTNSTNLQISRETNQFNQALAEQQNEWNLQQWNRENQYNDPSAQMQRLQAAGLSPAAAAAAVTGNTASSLTSAQLANQQMPSPMVAPQSQAYNPMFDDLNEFKYKEAVTKGQELSNERQAIENGSLPDFIFSDLDAKKLEYKIRSQELDHSAQLFPYSLEAAKEDLASKRNYNELHPIVKDIQKATLDKMRYDFDWLQKTDPIKLAKDLEEADARIRAANASAKNSLASAALSEENIGKVQKEKELLSIDGQIKAYEAILIKHGSPKDVASQTGALLAEGVVTLSDVNRAFENTKKYLDGQQDVFDNDYASSEYLTKVMRNGAETTGSYFRGGFGSPYGAANLLKRFFK